MPNSRIGFDALQEISFLARHGEDRRLRVPALKAIDKFWLASAQISRPNRIPSSCVWISMIGPSCLPAILLFNYLTDHYLNYPFVLTRLSRVDRWHAAGLLGMAYNFVTREHKFAYRKEEAPLSEEWEGQVRRRVWHMHGS